jgi:hypothetical protein
MNAPGRLVDQNVLMRVRVCRDRVEQPRLVESDSLMQL